MRTGEKLDIQGGVIRRFPLGTIPTAKSPPEYPLSNRLNISH